jgi:ABC-type nickel/cobalt efflux system permease component RcnA
MLRRSQRRTTASKDCVYDERRWRVLIPIVHHRFCKEEHALAAENISQPEEETFAQPVDETGSVAGSQEIAYVVHEHEHDHDHNHPHGHAHDHEHEHHKRAWYTTLNEDWLATIAGLILVVLLVVRVLHAIP